MRVYKSTLKREKYPPVPWTNPLTRNPQLPLYKQLLITRKTSCMPQVQTNRFRVQANHFSITWPQSDFDINECLEHLKSLQIGTKSVVEAIISSETHESGELHRHAYVKLSGRVDLRDPRKFDYVGRHANIQRCTNPNAWKNYVRKDGDYVEFVSDDAPQDSLFEWARSLSTEAYWEKCRNSSIPYGYAKNAFDTCKSEVDTITYEEDPNPNLEITFPDDLNNWVLETNKTNVLVGPTGVGKTVFMLRKMTHPILFITHMDQLKMFNPQRHKAVLFDDMKFDHWNVQSQIHLADRYMPRALHRRYGTTLIPTGIQIGITCNEQPFTWDPAIERRLNKLNLSFYSANVAVPG